MTLPRRVPALLLVLPLVVAATIASHQAQCSKPPIPEAGLPTAVDADVPVTYSDGYKTLATFTYPSTSAPACGWPLVVFVHGYGGKRSVQRTLASRGFAVHTYDVRGQGDAKNLNPTTLGLTMYGPVEKYDLAEQIAFARLRWKSLLEPTKVAVTGASQGGIHSWFAAAYSGKKITIPGRGAIVFPTISAAVPENFIPDVMHHFLRGDTLYAVDGINRVFGGNTSAVIDPATRTAIQQSFLNQDPTGLADRFRNEPGRPVATELGTSTVPVLYHHAWLDGIEGPREAVRVIETLPSTVLVRSMLSTLGHGSPANDHENTLRFEQKIRWFDRFLWDIANGVEKEARAVVGVLPVREAELTNRSFLWDHRHDAGFVPADLAPERRYLTASGRLELTPGSGGAPTTIRHRVNAGYTAQTFVSSPSQWSTSAILANIPLTERTFTLAPLTAEQEFGGRPRVSLQVVPSADRFTLAVLLAARVPGETRDFMLACWGQGVLGAARGVPLRLEFDLPPTVCVLPAGTVLKLTVRNHWLREFPMARSAIAAPYFVSCDVEVRHGTGADVSWVELPFRSAVRVGLVAALHVTPAVAPRNVPLTLRGGLARQGKPYLIAASLSGQVPGTPLPGGVVPANLDPVTSLFLLMLGTPLTPGFVGMLDASGQAQATCGLPTLGPLPAALAGHRLTLAAWVYRSPMDLTGHASNPVDVNFR